MLRYAYSSTEFPSRRPAGRGNPLAWDGCGPRRAAQLGGPPGHAGRRLSLGWKRLRPRESRGADSTVGRGPGGHPRRAPLPNLRQSWAPAGPARRSSFSSSTPEPMRSSGPTSPRCVESCARSRRAAVVQASPSHTKHTNLATHLHHRCGMAGGCGARVSSGSRERLRGLHRGPGALRGRAWGIATSRFFSSPGSATSVAPLQVPRGRACTRRREPQ